MQVCPALVNFPHTMRRATVARSVPSSTNTGDFPPSSSTVGVRCSAAARATIRPTAPLPV